MNRCDRNHGRSDTIELKEEDFRKFQLLKHDKYKPVIFSI